MDTVDSARVEIKPFAHLEDGKWYACIKFRRNGTLVAPDVIYESEPQFEMGEAMKLAQLYASRLRRSSTAI